MCSSGAISRRSAGPDDHQDDRDESAVAHWTEREIRQDGFQGRPSWSTIWRAVKANW